MKVEYRIMAVKARREKYILSMLESLGESENIVFYDEDRPKGQKTAMANARKTWLAPSAADSVCVLQDDLMLCNNFKSIIEECATQFPNAIFSFYQPRLTYTDKSDQTPYLKITGCGTYGQIIMIPTKMIPLVFYWIDRNLGSDYKHDDIAIGLFALTNDVPVMGVIPCPVQHLAHNDSELGYNNINKVSKVFEYNIDVDQFKTNKYVKSKSIPNSSILPKGGYPLGKLVPLRDLL